MHGNETAPLKTGLIGSSIQASRSPAIHVREARANGIDLRYDLFDLSGNLDELAQTLRDVCACGYAGVNVTHPYKQVIIPLLDEVAGDVVEVGAVNTVVFRNGNSIGYNTDRFGFRESFKRGLSAAKLGCVLQLGAGGAGAAVCHALRDLGVAEIMIFDTDAERAAAMINRCQNSFDRPRLTLLSEATNAVARADGIVNCTPVGMRKYPGTPIAPALLRSQQWVADIVYFPLETELLRAARAIGCRALNGGGMAVLQAAEAFRLFTGITPDVERMLAAFANDTARV